MNIYTLYKGDDFIDVGTAEELAESQGVKKDTIYFLASPSNLKRNRKNRKFAVKIEDDNSVEYEFYNNNKLIFTGTLDELSEKLAIKKRSIMKYATPSHKKSGSSIKVIRKEEF